MIHIEQHISVEKIKQGDVREFERLFRVHYKRLCIYVENITGNAFNAEDIVSNLFVRLWEKREQLQICYTIESYITSAARHDALNYLKHAEVEARYRAKAEYRLMYMDLLNPDAETPLSDIIEKERNEQIENALQTLPPQCREIFTLHKMDGLSYQEVADKLNISINTVRTQLTRAMKKMRVALKTLDPGFSETGTNSPTPPESHSETLWFIPPPSPILKLLCGRWLKIKTTSLPAF
ncbi:MAG: RNA polymerase sigma-70 factor [Tannerella sp.]|nr:RNA polymerase sigma-70 factor [Tannerella sp.]